MIFNSYSFILIFLPIVVTVHYLLKRLHRPVVSQCFLLCASFFFYGYHNKRALIVLIASMLFNYSVAYLMTRNKERPHIGKLLLAAGITVDIGALVYCKYLGFFSSLAASLFHSDFVMSYEGKGNDGARFTTWDGPSKGCYCFRIRSEFDESGKLKSCLYGKVYDGFWFDYVMKKDRSIIDIARLKFTYYLNKTPLERNLEYDSKRNLNPDREFRRMAP